MSRKRKSLKHLLVIFIGTFISAALVGSGSELLVKRTTMIVAWVLLLVVIGVGILFDIIGTAAAAATETPHHARAANKVFGAKQAVRLVRNADTVANFSNDIVGDVAGTLSGAMAATIIMDLLRLYPVLDDKVIILNTIMLALVASITVTGKAFGKSLAISEADEIIFVVGKIVATFENLTGLDTSKKKKKGGKKSGDAGKN